MILIFSSIQHEAHQLTHIIKLWMMWFWLYVLFLKEGFNFWIRVAPQSKTSNSYLPVSFLPFLVELMMTVVFLCSNMRISHAKIISCANMSMVTLLWNKTFTFVIKIIHTTNVLTNQPIRTSCLNAIGVATIASLLTISSTFSLSLQSSFHLSLAVLVRYRSLAHLYLALDEIYHPLHPRMDTFLELHSQTTRLFDCVWLMRDTYHLWFLCTEIH